MVCLPGCDSSVSEDRLVKGSSVDSEVDRVAEDGVRGRFSTSHSDSFSLSNSDPFDFW